MPMRRMLILMIAVIGIFGSDAFAIYAPSTGRFMQRDPIGYKDGMNLYQYVLSNPMKYTDPYGLEVYVKCVRCKKPGGDYKMTCSIIDTEDPSYLKVTESNDFPTVGPGVGNQPSETPGDPYGTNGPLEPGDYRITTHPMGFKWGNRPVVTNHPTLPNHITTSSGTHRDGIMFHDHYSYSKGCFSCVDGDFDNEIMRKTKENGGSLRLEMRDAGDCPDKGGCDGTDDKIGE